MADKDFKDLLGEALMTNYEQTLDSAGSDHVFSDGFEKEMDKLIKRRRKPYYKLVNTFGKRVACIAVVVVVAASTTVLSFASLREPVFNFFINLFSDHSTISTDSIISKAYPDINRAKYAITNDISEYKVEKEYSNANENYIHYQSGEKQIIFTQSEINDYNKNFNTEGQQIDNLQINGYDAIGYFDNHGMYSIVWNNGEYIFDLNSNIGKDALIEMAESVQKVE